LVLVFLCYGVTFFSPESVVPIFLILWIPSFPQGFLSPLCPTSSLPSPFFLFAYPYVYLKRLFPSSFRTPIFTHHPFLQSWTTYPPPCPSRGPSPFVQSDTLSFFFVFTVNLPPFYFLFFFFPPIPYLDPLPKSPLFSRSPAAGPSRFFRALFSRLSGS